jgi:hypothetical protein
MCGRVTVHSQTALSGLSFDVDFLGNFCESEPQDKKHTIFLFSFLIFEIELEFGTKIQD